MEIVQVFRGEARSLAIDIVNGARSVTRFPALRRNTALLLVALVLAGAGERLWLGLAPKYLEILGTVWF